MMQKQTPQKYPKKDRTKRVLSKEYKPVPSTVIIGKGKLPSQAPGNQRLVVLVKLYLKEYSTAVLKSEKTKIVSAILSSVKMACGKGVPAFVRVHDSPAFGI